jgi:uncharacterized protein (DUF1499 family)
MLTNGAEFGFWQKIGLSTGTRDDASPVEFSTLTRRASPNDALICPVNVCPKASADSEPPVFTISAEALRQKVRATALSEARTSEIATGASDATLRFVQRSLLLRYPDIIDVLIVPKSSGASTLAMYSRSLVGRSDLGVNRARLERWLGAISR